MEGFGSEDVSETKLICNMYSEIISVEKMTEGLDKLSEYWESASFEAKDKETRARFKSVKGYLPHPNLKMYRQVSFKIKASVSVDDIRSLAKVIRQRYKLDCFQVSVNRPTNEAHMLFVWLDEEMNGIVFTDFDYKKLAVLILRYLNLPRPAVMTPLVKFFLKDAYMLNEDVFSQQLDVLFHTRIPGINYSLLADALRYAESMCKGELK